MESYGRQRDEEVMTQRWKNNGRKVSGSAGKKEGGSGWEVDRVSWKQARENE